MITKENIGAQIKYWKSGWRSGVLKDIQGSTAIIHHSVLKKDQKISLSNCELLEGVKMSDTIFDHLFRVAQTKGVQKQQPGESDQDFLKKVLRAVHGVDEPTWNSLPIKAQQWYNDAATAVSTANPIPPCPGFNGKDEIQKVAETSVPPKGLTAQEALKQSVQVKPPITAQPKRKREVTGVMDALRRTVIFHPDWTTRQIFDYLKLNGFPNAKLDTISVDGGNIKRVIQIAKELGFWKEVTNAPVIQNEEEEVKKAG